MTPEAKGKQAKLAELHDESGTQAYEKFVKLTNQHPEGDSTGPAPHGLSGLCFELVGEVGEVCEILQKGIRKNIAMDATRRSMLFDELGDVLWAVTAIASRMGFSLEGLMDFNKSKLYDRLYHHTTSTVER